MKILINSPNFNCTGGVAKYYLMLKKYIKTEHKFYKIGNRSDNIFNFIVQLKDYLVYIKIIRNYNPDIIIVNPSLDKKAIIRDSIYLIISKIIRKKVIVFWHGWDKKEEIDLVKYYLNVFKIIFSRSIAFIVLSRDIEIKLKEWFPFHKIFIISAFVDDDFILKFKNKNRNCLLFMGRIEKSKGIYECIDAFKDNKILNNNFKLQIAGNGSELKEIIKYVNNNNFKNINFNGYIENEEKINILNKTLIYIFPSYSEGFPLSLLEAMSFGIPIITTPVGAIKDFFVEGKMGYIVDFKNSKQISNKIRWLINNPKNLLQISRYNRKYVKKNYLASKIANNFENILYDIYISK
jgi:glycosyltransferase involved in cell wall biosynthesis